MQRAKVIIDTNVLVSAFIFGGKPLQVIRKTFKTTEVYVSPEILTEYKETPRELEKEKKISSYQFELLIESIASFVSESIIVYPEKRLYICKDPEDDMLLECCLKAKADFLITGDKKLLEIKMSILPQEIKSLKIINPSQFVQITY